MEESRAQVCGDDGDEHRRENRVSLAQEQRPVSGRNGQKVGKVRRHPLQGIAHGQHDGLRILGRPAHVDGESVLALENLRSLDAILAHIDRGAAEGAGHEGRDARG